MGFARDEGCKLHKIMVKWVKREAEELQVRFANYKRIGRKNGGLFFPTFILRI